MAHPLTQHPPNVLAFGAPASMHPLGFGFGQPAHRPGGLGFGFGSPVHVSHPSAGPSTPTPLKRLVSPAQPRVSPSPAPTSTNNKRSRRRSESPSTSPSPIGSPRLSRGDDNDDRRKIAGSKATKRLRKETEIAGSAQARDGPDVGLLLASMPATSHLPILLELLNENPSLAPRVLKSMPTPPLANVLDTLERTVAKIAKAAGTWEAQDGVVAQRRWHRVEEQVRVFEKNASTYLKFFTTPALAPSNGGAEGAEPNTIFHLLHALTAHVQQLLVLVPTPNSPPQAARPLLDLANAILTAWNQWVAGLSDEVNNRCGMYPHGMVSSWADGLSDLAHPPSHTQQNQQNSAPIVSWSMAVSAPVQCEESSLVIGFREAVVPIRHAFVNNLGWMVR